MIQQYFDIKRDHPDSILFFRMGDFYEMFFEDAKIAAPILEVVLTSRDKNKKDSVPLCGIPYHAKDVYAAKLLKKGHKVAICEQAEDPALAKGIVKRKVTHILTPGTALEIDLQDEEINNYIVSIYQDKQAIAMASVDFSISQFEVRSYEKSQLNPFQSEFFRKSPKEIIIPQNLNSDLQELMKRFPEMENLLVTEMEEYEYNVMECEEILKNQFKIKSLEGIGLNGYPAAIAAAGTLLKYLQSLRQSALKNLTSIRFYPKEDHLILDAIAFRNLEITKNMRSQSRKGSLLEAVDFTVTPMGRRLLKQWISYPLTDINDINYRLDGVDEFSQHLIARTECRRILKHFGDFARLNSRIALNIALPSHLLKLKAILEAIPELKNEIKILNSNVLRSINKTLDPLKSISSHIDRAIGDEPSNHFSDGNIIREGYNRELDELRSIARNAKEIISSLEAEEKEKTGIPSLKIKYNKVFGYFIEITKTHLKMVPDHYIRKQTLVNAERFITQVLKELEDKILKAEERILQIEKKLFQEVVDTIQHSLLHLNQNADNIALLDVLAAGGELAQSRQYKRPRLTNGQEIEIKEGRHPVVEIGSDKGFIPNDTFISSKSDQILIITGPNMGGKSTFLRQNALIVILAQCGYFVPAERATIGICDRIFTRIGASDSLIEGKSTFLIEMIETSVILNNATEKSLILLDEIGRGTSTFDGLSIAWAVVEFLHTLPAKPKTLFATHYHELTELAEILNRIKNFHITVREWQDNIVFLHKIVKGATDQSFGIHVAKIAGIPGSVIERAKDILLNLEKKELNRLVKERITGKLQTVPQSQKNLFPEDAELKIWDEIRDQLKEIDISSLTPLEALNILHYLKLKSDNLQ